MRLPKLFNKKAYGEEEVKLYTFLSSAYGAK
jgi:hypothetical protein